MFQPANLLQRLSKRWPARLWQDVTCIVAVSGGADSVALLRLFSELRDQTDGDGQLIVAHFNHGWRGDESDEDESFVRSLSGQLSRRIESGSLNSGSEPIAPTEVAARNARYDYLLELAHRTGARYIATAHTSDDQAETILHRILRGTGIQGLAGIPGMRSLSESVNVVRPLLDVSRAEVVEYLDSIGQSFRIDSTNYDCKFTRNQIRHELLPKIRDDYNAGVNEALIRLGKLALETQLELSSQLEGDLTDSVNRGDNGQVTVDRRVLSSLSPLMQRELFRTVWQSEGWPLQEMGFEQWTLLTNVGTSTGPTHANLPGNIQVTVQDKVIRMKKLATPGNS